MAEKRLLVVAAGVLVAALGGCDPATDRERQPAFAAPAATGGATVQVDVPDGMDIVPGGVMLGISLHRTGNIASGRRFPMTKVASQPLADGRTRHVFSLGEPQTATLLRLRSEAGRPGPGERSAPEVVISPGFELCRTGPVPDERPMIVTSQLLLPSLPATPPSSTDLHQIGRGRGFETAFRLCAND